MEIIKEYNELSKAVLKNDEDITCYSSSLNESIEALTSFKLNKKISTILFHPVKLIRNSLELKRLTVIKDNFEKLYNTNLVSFIEEETGYIEQDLKHAMNTTKPKILKRFIKENPIKK